MTERFEIFPQNVCKDGTLIIIQKNKGLKLYNISDVVELLNTLHEENKQLRHDATILIQSNQDYRKENEQLKSDKEHLMGCLIRFFGYDDEDIDYNLNRESNQEYGKQYYSMKEETKKELE